MKIIILHIRTKLWRWYMNYIFLLYYFFFWSVFCILISKQFNDEKSLWKWHVPITSMNYHECPGTFIQKENILTLGNKIYFARKVDGFVWICKTISYYAKFNNHYDFIWCFYLSNFWLKSKSDGFLIDMILAVFSNRKWSAFLWICWNHVTKVTFWT